MQFDNKCAHYQEEISNICLVKVEMLSFRSVLLQAFFTFCISLHTWKDYYQCVTFSKDKNGSKVKHCFTNKKITLEKWCSCRTLVLFKVWRIILYHCQRIVLAHHWSWHRPTGCCWRADNSSQTNVGKLLFICLVSAKGKSIWKKCFLVWLCLYINVIVWKSSQNQHKS